MNLSWRPRCASTQDELWAASKSVCAIATTHQTTGRGRRGRSWISAPHTGLAVSWRAPTAGIRIESLPLLSLAAGVALHRWSARFISAYATRQTLAGTSTDQSSETISRELSLKWPNDLLYRGEKLGGILCEGRLSSQRAGEGKWAEERGAPEVLIGIGVNLTEAPDLSHLVELQQRVTPPTHLNAVLSSHGAPPLTLSELCDEVPTLIGELNIAVERLRESPSELLSSWAQRSIPLGTRLSAQDKIGSYRGINERGALLLDIEGTLCTVEAGEVHLISAPPTTGR